MKKKLIFTLILGSLTLACIGAGCSKLTKVEENQKKGYKISVTYDANGGSFLNRPGITVMDMFNPSDYEKDESGEIHIKLLEPTDPSRPTSSSDPITLTQQNHFFAGWYQTREVKTIDGVPVDWDGEPLTKLEDGTYVYAVTADEEEPTEATPAYNYSDYWNFETDTIDYSEDDDILSITLYAGWVPYYEFHYYYQKDGNWEKLDEETSFDYKTTNAVATEADKDTIYLPVKEDGAMKHEFTYLNHSTFQFPRVSGKTFVAAYTDEACTAEIVGSFEHQGTLVLASGENKALVVENRIQNIYLKLDEGERYWIDTAEQLVKNPNSAGYYEISGDLDFTGLTWPAAFNAGEFTGKMYGKDGAAVTLSNITVNHSSEKKFGGLFGKISETASFTNITFKNVTVNLENIGSRNNDASFGLFAGVIEDGATFTNVTVDGTLRIGKIGRADNLSFQLLANGNTEGITAGKIGLQFYGVKLIDQYEYTVKTETVQIAPNGDITFEFYPSSGRLNEEIIVIQ